ncbi:hypothetical protein CRP212_gp31 [Roseobacter phage CRP-212]|nr:hypothetical protein CRP212_gp31 [Roseobacter phage CRP-212]
MSKARTLADFISDGSEFADGTISVAEVSGAAPLASPSFTGNLTTGGNIILDEASASAHGEATKSLTASGNGYYQDLLISANDYDFRYGPSAWNSAYSALQISSTGGVVFNEGGLDADTRFEGTSDSNVLAVNAGNNRVGVGTNGGLHKLSVLHTGTALGGVAHFSIGTAASAYATTVFRIDDVNNNFAIDQNYASQDHNRLFIKRSNGYVGIGGVTSPNAMLHVESNGSGNYAAIVNHTQATNPNGLWINYSGSGYIDTYALRIQNTDGVIWDQRGTGSLLHYAQDNATVRFNTGAASVDFQVKSDLYSDMLFVDGSANRVGIGTGSPQATFVVAGTNGVQNSSNVVVVSGGTTNGHGLFKVFNSSGTSKFRVDAELGRVGINNDSPSWAFDVQAGAAGQIGTFYDTGTNGGGMYNGAAVLSVSRRSNGSTSQHGELFRVGRDNSDSTSYNVSESFFTVRSDSVVVNESSNSSLDFRIESDSNANAFKVDAGQNSGQGAVLVGTGSMFGTGNTDYVAHTMTQAASTTPMLVNGAMFAMPDLPSGKQAQAGRWKFGGFKHHWYGSTGTRVDSSLCELVLEINGGSTGKTNLELFEVGFNRGWDNKPIMVEVYEKSYLNGGYKKYLFNGGYDPSFTLYENYGNNSFALNVLAEGPFQNGTSSVASSTVDASYYRKTVRATMGAYWSAIVVVTIPSYMKITNNAEVDNNSLIRLLNPQ